MTALPCTLDPETWFADDEATQERAITWCRRCPQQAACLAGAIERDEPCGVWGAEVFPGTAVPVDIAASAHGNRAAYCKGCRCDPCTEANARYVAEWRTERRWTEPVTQPGILFVQLSIDLEGAPA